MGKKGEETKQLIREKACSLFARKGFKSVTMKDICIETGLSRGGLYRHYDSTNQIFSEIIDSLMSAQDNELTEKMEKGYSAVQILDEILERYKHEMSDQDTSLSMAIFEFYSENQLNNEDNMLLKQYNSSVDIWKEFILYGIQRGEFKNVNYEEVIDIIIFSYQGVRIYSSILPLSSQISERVISHIKKTLLV